MAKEINEKQKLIVNLKNGKNKLKNCAGDTWGSLSLDENFEKIENKFNSIKNQFLAKETEVRQLNDSIQR